VEWVDMERRGTNEAGGNSMISCTAVVAGGGGEAVISSR